MSTPQNVNTPTLHLQHTDLQRVGDSEHKSVCPACHDGVLLAPVEKALREKFK
jgi:hypothetical protein